MDFFFQMLFLSLLVRKRTLRSGQLETQEKVIQRTRVPRVFRCRSGLDALSDRDIIEKFRLNKDTLMVLYQEISDFLEPLTGRSHSIPGMVKLLAVLHFLATGSFQSVTGVVVGMSQPSFSRHLTVVLSALLTLVPKYVCFPTTPEEWHKVKLAFYRIAHMPNVLGAIDCIQVALRPPRFMEEQYKNRKQLNSLNVQMVCDAHLRIMSVHYGFPGSCNDSHILRRSPLFRKFEEGHMPEGWLLGTATYGCRPWLLTPLLNPRTPADHKYNDAHKSTHSTIEKTFDELKSKFRCLDHSEGVLQYSPRKVWDIVLVTCMLYNLTLRQGELPSDLDPLPEEQNGDEISLESTEGGIAVRSMLISSYFQCYQITDCKAKGYVCSPGKCCDAAKRHFQA